MSELDWMRDDAWWHVTAPLSGGSSNRSAALLDRILDQFRVEVERRYQPARDSNGRLWTKCNIFVNDATRALGCEVAQREWGRRECPNCHAQGSALVELDANAMIDWLAGPQGRANGWTECLLGTAIQSVKGGYPLVVTYRNPTGIGHVAMGTPPPAGPDDGRLYIAQAGASNFRRGPVSQSFGHLPVRYFLHR